MEAIGIHALTRRYGTLTALDGVSFSVGRGELFGLIGPDGAGKTTLFRLLATLLEPDSGRAEIDGLDIVRDYRAIRRRVGYMPGRFSLYPDLSVEENLAFFAALFGTTVAENYDLVAPIYRQIEPFRKRRAGKLSGGMKQKLIEHFDTHEDLAHMLKMRARPGDVILFKGSRGMRMEKALALFFKEEEE